MFGITHIEEKAFRLGHQYAMGGTTDVEDAVLLWAATSETIDPIDWIEHTGRDNPEYELIYKKHGDSMKLARRIRSDMPKEIRSTSVALKLAEEYAARF